MLGIAELFNTDVVVVGGGGAAMRAALASQHEGAATTLVVKSKILSGGSTASGRSELMGIAAALKQGDPRNSPEAHFQDTMAVSGGLVKPELVRVLAEEAPERINDLASYGVPFAKEAGRMRLWMSDAATFPRTLRAGRHTSWEIACGLARELERIGVRVEESVMVFRVVVDDDGEVVGVLGITQEGRIVLIVAKAVVLATGGAHQCYSENTATPDMTGDGYAMALQAGAELVNMEFIQMVPGVTRPLKMVLSKPFYDLSPAFRNRNGEEVLNKHLPPGITREEALSSKIPPFTTSNASCYIDIALHREALVAGIEGNYLEFDVTRAGEESITRMVPNIYATLEEGGLDIARTPFLGTVLAQCFNGGVLMVDAYGSTSVPGLYVAGEVAGGVRGADRPGGNALAECQVFGRRAGIGAAQRAAKQRARQDVARVAERTLEEMCLADGRASECTTDEIVEETRQLMWRYCLIARDKSGLQEVQLRLKEVGQILLESRPENSRGPWGAIEARNLVISASAIVAAALTREESRGSHYRTDYPERDDSNWRKFVVVSMRDGPLEIRVETRTTI